MERKIKETKKTMDAKIEEIENSVGWKISQTPSRQQNHSSGKIREGVSCTSPKIRQHDIMI